MAAAADGGHAASPEGGQVGPWAVVEVVVAASDDAHGLLRGLVARRLGVGVEDVVLAAAPCPSCGRPHGRPYVAAASPVPSAAVPLPHVSLASSGGVVAVAVSDAGPVGVDVEAFDRTGFAGFDGVALHPDERAAVRDARARATVWTRKEAVLKAAGVGLLVDPADVVVSAPHAPPALVAWPRRPVRVVRPEYLPLPEPAAVRLRDVPAPDGFVAAVAVVTAP